MIFNFFRNKDNITQNSDSSILRKRLDLFKIANNRMNMMGIIIVLIFSLIIIRLFYVQLLSKESYERKLEAYASIKQYSTTPRGNMYDANGNLVVTNVESLSIIYNQPKSISSDEEWELLEKFANTFEMDSSSLTDRELRELYLLLDVEGGDRYANGNRLLSDDEYEKAMRNEISTTDIYNLKLERINQEELDKIPDSKKKAYTVKKLVLNNKQGQAIVVMEDVTSKQAAYLSEHQDDFPGFSVNFDWDRSYPYGNSMKSILGNVSTTQQGLPQDYLQHYQALGYSLNSRVGTSGLEQTYEYLLAGQRGISEVKYANDGSVILNQLQAGRNGYDLQLTVDMELQVQVDKILTEQLKKYEDNNYRRFMNNLFVTIMDPNTGNIIVMSSIERNEDNIYYDNASGNYQYALLPGSTVKGGTVYLGLNEEVIDVGEKIYDSPIRLYATPVKSSFTAGIGLVDEVGALAKSSNVYMWHIAMRLGGTNYYDNCVLSIKDGTLELMKQYYSSFGLGVKTGIDVSNESTGYTTTAHSQGLVLDYAIGQFESYTMVQLAQYASSIANGGYRVKPRLVSYAYETNSDKNIVFENKVEVLNEIKGDSEYLETVQKGFEACVDTRFCGNFDSVGVDVAAKTGTAETFSYDEELKKTINTSNSLIIGYAPTEKPTVAFACSAPFSSADTVQPNICSQIMPEILKLYFDKYQ